jgi:hypothetical protein
MSLVRTSKAETTKIDRGRKGGRVRNNPPREEVGNHCVDGPDCSETEKGNAGIVALFSPSKEVICLRKYHGNDVCNLPKVSV